MSLIVCTDPCVYQKDGCCTLVRASSPGETARSGCINFVPVRTSQEGGHGLPDVGDTDQLQSLG